MRENGLTRCTAIERDGISIGKPPLLIPNVLQRQFTVSPQNKVWVTDITYVRTWQCPLD